MKAVGMGVGFVFLLMLCSCSDQKLSGMRSQEDLLTEVCNGVEKKDVNIIMRLGYWDNVPNRVSKGLRTHIVKWFDYYKEPRCMIRGMSKKEREPIRAHGKIYVWNIEPVGFIVIRGSDPEYGSSDLPFGVRNGRYYIAARYPKG